MDAHSSFARRPHSRGPLRRGKAGRSPLALLAGAAVVAIVGLALLGRVPQPAGYHRLVDSRAWLGVPNAWNVLSNLAFLGVGVAGLAIALRPARDGASVRFVDPRERAPWIVVFVGALLTAFGSAWYHLEPGNERLVLDRLPMTLVFVGLFAAVLNERAGARTNARARERAPVGTRWLLPMALVGFGSVVYWRWTESAGSGDLRPYAFVQFFSCVAMVVLLLTTPALYTRTGGWWLAFACYGAAKACERWDGELYEVTRRLASGHSLKHLFAAASIGVLARMLALRRPLAATGAPS